MQGQTAIPYSNDSFKQSSRVLFISFLFMARKDTGCNEPFNVPLDIRIGAARHVLV